MDLHSISNRKGFTLIEILVVILISALLTGLVIVYSGASRDTVSLSVKATEVAQTLLRAKSLAVSTYSVAGQPHACGYGVAFDPSADTFSLVSYVPSGGGGLCPLAGAPISGDDLVSYSSSTWQVSVGPGVFLVPGGPSLALYYPPNPITLLSNSSCTPGDTSCTYVFTPLSMTVTLATNDGNASDTIVIGTAGQVDIR